MANDFHQTVNLKEKAEEERRVMLGQSKPAPQEEKPVKKPEPAPEKKTKKPGFSGESKRAQAIDEIYNGGQGEKQTEKYLKSISQPKARPDNSGIYKGIIAFLVLVILATFGYFLYFNKFIKGRESANVNQEPKWYAVELVTGKVYYGEIKDTTADPIIMDKVYYDYDQMNTEGGEKNETGNLRLVKRGKETHGPSGEMEVVRSQVVYMEPLGPDSKVLKAILDYEK